MKIELEFWKQNSQLPDGDAMLGLGVPDASNTVEEERGGQGGTEHMAWPGQIFWVRFFCEITIQLTKKIIRAG